MIFLPDGGNKPLSISTFKKAMPPMNKVDTLYAGKLDIGRTGEMGPTDDKTRLDFVCNGGTRYFEIEERGRYKSVGNTGDGLYKTEKFVASLSTADITSRFRIYVATFGANFYIFIHGSLLAAFTSLWLAMTMGLRKHTLLTIPILLKRNHHVPV